MAELTDTEIDAAIERGKVARAIEPRAKAARYDARRGEIVVKLANGCTFSFPPAMAQGLASATAQQLAGVEILGGGNGLHWESLDVDFSVPGLLNGLFGTAAYMARRAGGAKTPAKAAAARANGSKGGRPRKTA